MRYFTMRNIRIVHWDTRARRSIIIRLWSAKNVYNFSPVLWGALQQEDTQRFNGDTKEDTRKLKEEMKEFKDKVERFEDKVDKMISEMNRRWGELANKMGTVVEDIIVPAMPVIAKKYFGCEEIDMIADRIVKKHPKDKSRVREFDALVVCGDKVLLNETKVTPRISSIRKFIDFVRSGEFFEYFPEYKGKKIIPIVSSLDMPEDIVGYLTKEGIYAMAMNGDYMDILNFDEVNKIRG